MPPSLRANFTPTVFYKGTALNAAVVAFANTVQPRWIGNGGERSMTAWIKMKIAVVRPIPRANVGTAPVVNTSDSLNCRKE